jgi:hypothetical protein
MVYKLTIQFLRYDLDRVAARREDLLYLPKFVRVPGHER